MDAPKKMSETAAVFLAVATFLATGAVIIVIQRTLMDDFNVLVTLIPLVMAAGASWITYRLALGRDPFT